MPKDEASVKDQHDDSALSDEFVEFLDKLRTKTENDSDNRIGWKRKLVTSNNQRIGVKRVSRRPYPGAPNIPLPEADKLISKRKASFVLAAFMNKKKVRVQIADGVEQTPEKKAKAERAEKGLNHVLNNKLTFGLLHILTLASDNFLEKGHALFKVFERFNKRMVNKVIDLDNFPEDRLKQLKSFTRPELVAFVAERFDLDAEDDDDREIIDDVIDQFKSGEKIIRFQVPEIESFPDITVRPTEKVTPPSYAREIEKVERLRDEFFLTKRQLEDMAEDKIYDKKIVDNLSELDFTGKGSQDEDEMIESQKERNEGVIDENVDELFRIHEIYAWWKAPGEKRFSRWVYTFLADIPGIKDSLLQKIPFPFEFGTWNWVKHDNEIKDARWHASRGIPEKIRALQEFMERSVNNILIRDDINNAPLFTVLNTSKIQANSVRFIPGQKIKVKSHDEIRRLDDLAKVDVSSERINSLLKAFAEEYIGSTDQLFRNATNKGGGKTLGEIKLGVQVAAPQVILEVLRWLISLKKAYTMCYQIMSERLGQSMFIDGLEVSREDFDPDFVVIPNGSIDLANTEVRVGKAQVNMGLALQLPPEISTMDDKYNAVFDFYEASGVEDPDRYITKPEITQQAEQQGLQEEDQILQQQEQNLTEEIRARKAQEIVGGAGAQQ